MTAPWDAPSLTTEERAEALMDALRERHERDSTPFVGCAVVADMQDDIASAIRTAVAAERERCARVAEVERERWNKDDRLGLAYWSTADRIARAIRRDGK